jgi:hypothetical protein
MIEEYIQRVENAIAVAQTGESSKLTEDQFALPGMSSRWNRILLNELVKEGDKYLEIGVWRGSTFVAANFKNNPAYAIAIDNFSQFGNHKDEFISLLPVHLSQLVNKMVLIDCDCFDLNEESDAAVLTDNNVYFYDGAHEAEDQRKALTYYIPKLADKFIYIVDDWNYEPAQIGTRQGIAENNLKIHKEWILPSAFNGDTATWWNGIYIAVCEKTQ